uniref:J domain-containing protein n=1 Tax=Meloidogyne incognita TaxID=6306 RepID=A0A914LVQ7_MELIC
MAFSHLILLLSFFNFVLKIEATHYKTLKVDKNASPIEIEDAFYEMKETNRNAKQSDKAFIENLKKLSEAYNVLSDKTKREEYDSELAKNKGKSKEGESSNAGMQKAEDTKGLKSCVRICRKSINENK